MNIEDGLGPVLKVVAVDNDPVPDKPQVLKCPYCGENLTTKCPAVLGPWVITLDMLRAYGWMVAVHNDYKLNGQPMTFWLFTHSNGKWIKGEAATDTEALGICWTQHCRLIFEIATTPNKYYIPSESGEL